MSGIKNSMRKIVEKNKYLKAVALWLLYSTKKIFYYFLSKIFHIDEKSILFASFRGRSYSCNPRAIYEALLEDERFADFTFIWAFNEPWKYSEDPRFVRATLIKYHSYNLYKYLACSKYWILNMGVPPNVLVKPGQVYVQTWHGTPLKRLGCDLDYTKNARWSDKEIFQRYREEGKKMTFLISPSAFATDKLSSAFNLQELEKEKIVLETGYPRNDFLINYTERECEKAKERLNLPADKKILLYAPTWRDDQYVPGMGYTYDLQADFDRMKRDLGEDFIVLFRAHYLVANSLDFNRYDGFVFDVSDMDDINDLYIVSDILVTDYSSVFFDYANLNKPIVFYMYDLEEYKNEIRGFYFSLEELPGPVTVTEEDLVVEIKKEIRKDLLLDEKYQNFKKRFAPREDGKASERVIEHVLLGKGKNEK